MLDNCNYHAYKTPSVISSRDCPGDDAFPSETVPATLADRRDGGRQGTGDRQALCFQRRHLSPRGWCGEPKTLCDALASKLALKRMHRELGRDRDNHIACRRSVGPFVRS